MKDQTTQTGQAQRDAVQPIATIKLLHQVKNRGGLKIIENATHDELKDLCLCMMRKLDDDQQTAGDQNLHQAAKDLERNYNDIDRLYRRLLKSKTAGIAIRWQILNRAKSLPELVGNITVTDFGKHKLIKEYTPTKGGATV